MDAETNKEVSKVITDLSKVITENKISRTSKEHLEILKKWIEVIN